MVPSESLLAVPLSVTNTPAVTVWLVPALAVGATFGGGGGGFTEPPPPPPPQPARSEATRAAVTEPSVLLCIALYTGIGPRRWCPKLSPSGARDAGFAGIVHTITPGAPGGIDGRTFPDISPDNLSAGNMPAAAGFGEGKDGCADFLVSDRHGVCVGPGARGRRPAFRTSPRRAADLDRQRQLAGEDRRWPDDRRCRRVAALRGDQFRRAEEPEDLCRHRRGRGARHRFVPARQQ